eukprot:CAMPEP_0196827490 /NCGR_PEP_ID=MMETSP1362-20130617/94183_1 /TAXON_ID=163516 /ORGANISM="Leptocylindrus danicus, Strain CCMP1856" /LENGTH=885 /DNA_ID=CAMNT_0042208129 /DNA_START=510 /DNA_END=3167 /DNA_ORIENTATION=-
MRPAVPTVSASASASVPPQPTPSSSDISAMNNMPPKLVIPAAAISQPQRVKSEASTPKSSGGVTPTPRGRKRGKAAAAAAGSDDEGKEPDGWFLKYQNKALVAELRALQTEVTSLTGERDARRIHSKAALTSVQIIENQWMSMEYTLSQISQHVLQRLDKHSDISDADRTVLIQAANSNFDASTATAGDDVLGCTNVSSPPSTGSGDSIESLPALLHTISRLTKSSLSVVASNGTYQKQQNGDDLEAFSLSIASRTKTLCDIFNAILRQVEKAISLSTTRSNGGNKDDVLSLRQEMLSMKSIVSEQENVAKQLALARDEALLGQRRARRALNRLAAGAELRDVLKVAEPDDDDSKSAINDTKSRNSVTSMDTTTSKKDETLTVAETDSDTAKRLSELDALCDTREKRISELLENQEQLQKKINNLSTPPEPPSPDTIKKSEPYLELKAAKIRSESTIERLTSKRKIAEEGWSEAKGAVELAKKTARELQEKHDRRWTEITKDLDDKKKSVTQKEASHDVTLEHKLRQALEAARLGESTKKALREAEELTENLQDQVNGWKLKFEEAVANGKGSNSNSPVPATPESASHRSHTPSRDRDIPYEKLKRDNSKLRKEVTAVHASRDAAKAKVERAENQCESFAKQNARLLKQAHEKDEVNANALSSILHLKHLAELHAQEKEALEKKAKAASQLALAARLAANAKERLEEEAKKEKEALEEKLEAAELRQKSLFAENTVANAKMRQSSGQVERLEKQMKAARERCEELISVSSAAEEDKTRLAEKLSVAEKELKRGNVIMDDSSRSKKRSRSSDSQFSREELELTIESLMKRLSCPVCDFGQKECMITSCRHMFCKKCIEKNIKNRNRKCPACGARFDAKDVADVFLD